MFPWSLARIKSHTARSHRGALAPIFWLLGVPPDRQCGFNLLTRFAAPGQMYGLMNGGGQLLANKHLLDVAYTTDLSKAVFFSSFSDAAKNRADTETIAQLIGGVQGFYFWPGDDDGNAHP